MIAPRHGVEVHVLRISAIASITAVSRDPSRRVEVQSAAAHDGEIATSGTAAPTTASTADQILCGRVTGTSSAIGTIPYIRPCLISGCAQCSAGPGAPPADPVRTTAGATRTAASARATIEWKAHQAQQLIRVEGVVSSWPG